MAIALDTAAGGRSVAYVSDGSSNSTITVNKPANVVDGDLMVAIVSNKPDGVDPSSEITAPAGWTRVGHTPLTRWLVTTGIFVKFAASEGSSYQFTLPMANAQDDGAIILRVTGADTSQVLAGNVSINADDSSTTLNIGSIQTRSANALMICGGATTGTTDHGANTSSVPSGYTRLYENNSRVNSAGIALAVAYKTQATAGPSGPLTWTSFDSAAQYATQFHLALHASGETQTAAGRDNFTGTANTPLATYDPSWTNIRGATTYLRIASNGTSLEAEPAGFTTSEVFTHSGFNSLAADSEVSFKINSLDRGTDNQLEAQLILRAVDGSNYYMLTAADDVAGSQTNSLRIRKRLTGTVSTLSTATVNSAFVDGDTITFRAVGTTLTAYVNGTLVDTVTDSSFSTGGLGIGAYRSSANGQFAIDWWEGNDNYSAAPPGAAPILLKWKL